MNKTILLSATEIGGAQNLVFLANAIKSRSLKCKVIASEATIPLFNFDNNIELEQTEIQTIKDAIHYLSLEKPYAVVCGTAHHLGPERFLTLAAKQLKITSLVFLDEWFNYRMRFENENGQLLYLPDIICCQDERAQREAIAEGLPPQALFITGSPYLSTLAQNIKYFLRDSPFLPDFLVNKTRPVITFLSEAQSVYYGATQGARGSLGKFIGYTEHIVRNDIFDILDKIGEACTIIEKLHPDDESIYEPLGNEFIDWFVIRQTPLWPLLWHSDLVIGMRSMALLEAAILGCLAVSYQPHLIGPQLCTAVRFNLIKGVYNKEELCSWIDENIRKKANRQRVSVRRLPFVRDDVLQNIMHLIDKR